MVLIPMLLCTAFMVPPDVIKLGITCAAGATGALCFYPLDLLKTRLQSSTGAQEFGNSFDAAMQVPLTLPACPCLLGNVFDVAVQVVATEGPLGLYNGLPVQLIGIMPVVSVQLLTNDALRGICPPVVAGMLTGLLQVSVSNPFEAIKVRLQLQGGCSDVSSLLGELGFKGLCRGWQVCVYTNMYALHIQCTPTPVPWLAGLCRARRHLLGPHVPHLRLRQRGARRRGRGRTRRAAAMRRARGISAWSK